MTTDHATLTLELSRLRGATAAYARMCASEAASGGCGKFKPTTPDRAKLVAAQTRALRLGINLGEIESIAREFGLGGE